MVSIFKACQYCFNKYFGSQDDLGFNLVVLTCYAQNPPVRSKTQRISFLDLPRSLREQIYDEANIGGDKFIDLNFWTIEEGSWKDHEGQPLNKVPRPVLDYRSHDGDRSPYFEESFPFALLMVGSRLIHKEVLTKLYAHNTFAVSLLGPGGLRPLDHLGDTALRELRVLIVSLRPCKCLTPFCSKNSWGFGECGVWPRPRSDNFWNALQHLSQGSHSRPLGHVSRTDKLTLARWRRTCARIASNTRPNQLSLYLTAEPGDTQIANAILAPLRALPVLRDAAINLGTHLRNIEAKLLARDMALSLTDKLHYPPFRFLDLPVELQMHILQLTRLVDDSFVVWDSRKRLKGWASRRNCYGCVRTHSFVDRETFCSERHSGTFNPNCECRDSALPYFLVSKAFAEVARSVFYARNEFRLFPRHSGQTDRIAGYDTFEGDGYYELTLSSFLACVPQRHVSSLTHITLIIPPLAPTYLSHQERHSWTQWLDSIKSLRQSADLSRLTLDVHFSDQDPLPYLPADPDTFQHRSMLARRTRDPTLEKNMLAAYRRILAPMKILGPELRALLVYVAWPLCKDAHGERKADEKMLGRMIMGGDYDSAKWGKRDISPYSQPKRGY
ncbi:hypothetical protein N0V93_007067 [Gnomoniopsis smithogilvyi]|uniref:F-box domain-containing protein n=1 Tax=Gnomoniopsis smithogilvyi TaxID=1191159 RepID=A0A9W8YQW6_9PEZI|nr:hypothetical protein N0V93_007067 [Gnomoniopsis smithogilvyi]